MKGALPLVVSCLALAAAGVAAAAEPRVVDLSIVIDDGGRVIASFALRDGFTAELTERLESGLPTGFSYELHLSRDRQWFDAGIESARLEVVAMFNAVTRDYLVNTKLDGRLIDSLTLRDHGDLERAMTRFTALPVFTLEPDAARGRYLVRARVELGTRHVLGFIPILKASSWTESNKVRLKAP